MSCIFKFGEECFSKSQKNRQTPVFSFFFWLAEGDDNDMLVQ